MRNHGKDGYNRYHVNKKRRWDPPVESCSTSKKRRWNPPVESSSKKLKSGSDHVPRKWVYANDDYSHCKGLVFIFSIFNYMGFQFLCCLFNFCCLWFWWICVIFLRLWILGGKNVIFKWIKNAVLLNCSAKGPKNVMHFKICKLLESWLWITEWCMIWVDCVEANVT